MSLGILTNEFIPLDQPNRPSPKGVNMPLKKKKLYPHRQHPKGQRYRRNPINTSIFLLFTVSSGNQTVWL